MAVRPRIVASILLLATVAACTMPGQTPVRSTAATPTSTPSLTCTGTGPAPSPFPCDGKTRDAEQRTLEDQARATYERYRKEYTRLLQAGGATEATPEIKATVVEPMLGNVVALLKYQKDQAWKPDPFVASHKMQVQAIQIRDDAEVTLLLCEDLRGSILYDASGKQAGQGKLAVQFYALKRIGGAMTIYDGDANPPGTECPI